MGSPSPLSPRPYPLVCTALLLCALTAPSWAKPQQSGPTGPKIWLQDNQPLQVVYHATAAIGGSSAANGTPQAANLAAAQILASGQAQPLALARGDFDADGVDDLAVGYATSGRGQFPSPFLPDVEVLTLPVRPDFVAVGSFASSSYPDIVVAARGDSSIYL